LIEVPSADAQCLTMLYKSSGSAMVVFTQGRLPVPSLLRLTLCPVVLPG
jgi:hypothetical protein